MKHSLPYCFIASFIATLVLSMIMVMKKTMGLMPEMNPIMDLVTIMQNLSALTISPLFAWFLHFLIGTFMWGILFFLLYGRLPGGKLIKGILFGLGVWLLMMLTIEPLAGHGFFGLQTSPVIAVMSMMLHIVFGAILGIVYGKLCEDRLA